MKNGITTHHHFHTTITSAVAHLERESRKYLLLGYITGAVFISSLEPFITYKEHPIIQDKSEKRKHIIVTFITLPSEPETPEPSVIEQKNREIIQERIEEIIKEEFQEEPFFEKSADNSFQLTTPFQTFPDIGAVLVIPVQDTLKQPDELAIFPKNPKPEKKPVFTIKEPEDERRRFKKDFFGFELQSIGFVPLHIGRHAVKSTVWKIGDIIKKKNSKKIRHERFATLNHKDVRMLILLWRDERIDPRKLSKKDRLFIAEKSSGKTMTHASYLSDMEKRGIVTSLMVSGRIVFKTNFSRDEVLHSLVNVYSSRDIVAENDSVFSYIKLINNGYDSSKKKIIVPETIPRHYK